MDKISKTLKRLEPDQLPKYFDSAAAEAAWTQAWEEAKVYHYDPKRPREETFVVDTPPPTVSGSLHIGHVFSYSHTDIIVRFHRMRGKNIFYPMGWDDNGLPTERRVQNYFHVRCDPHMPYEKDFQIEKATAKQRKKLPQNVSRANFIELCHLVTQEDEKIYQALWKRLALSVDWRQEYATISDHARHIAQLSFWDLFKKEHVYTSESPVMWDVDFQTAVAQAEIDERNIPSAFYDISFGVDGTDKMICIATTRPELLPACVGVTAHPEDTRYRHLFGKQAITPLFEVPVPIFPSPLVDPEKGSGIVMVCTFGDAVDVEWWRKNKLLTRQIISRNGRLMNVTFGEDGWESRNVEKANRLYQEVAGKPVKVAKRVMVELLADPANSFEGSDVPILQKDPKPIEHTVKFYEKGDKPLELISTRQWFVRLLDKREALLAMGNQINWHPESMRNRYQIWTENLQYDWCISRQRYFGVPIPIWYPVNGDGEPDYNRPILCNQERFPIDPMVDVPDGYHPEQRNQPGGFMGEADVFDTWFTSSMTPQISSKWLLDPKRHGDLFPAEIRPQAHEIIRTWAFYTIAKSMLHQQSIPWKNMVISGWVLAADRKAKMAKSVGNIITPSHLFDRYTVDGVRYWAAKARLGVDTAFDENMLKIGKRLITKLYNAAKFVYTQPAQWHSPICELDRCFIDELKKMVKNVTTAFENFEFAQALDDTERFFWRYFTDSYLELVKKRARSEDDVQAGSAIAGLRLGMSVLLRLFAPFLPYITEEIWAWVLAEETGVKHIHKAPWPGKDDFEGVAAPDDSGSFEVAVSALTELHKYKANAQVSMGREIESLVIAAQDQMLQKFTAVASDVMDAARAGKYQIKNKQELAADEFEVLEASFVE